MESTDSSSHIPNHPQLLPGFRFHPTDEELVVHYLKKKAASSPLPVTIIADIDLYKFDPWELPSKATFGEQEWYFFSRRERKYPNGARPNRAATSGYWKATGTDKPILTCNGTQKVGVKKALVFYGGKPPKGVKTNWIMHEYRLLDHNPTSSFPKPPASSDVSAMKKSSSRLDDWVLCRIYKKSNTQRPMMERDIEESMEAKLYPSSSLQNPIISTHQNPKPHNNNNITTKPNNFTTLLEHDDHNFFEGILSSSSSSAIDHHHHHHVISPPAPKITSLPLKLPRPSGNLWMNDKAIATGSIGTLSPTKGFQGDLNSCNSAGTDQENNSLVTTQFHHPNSVFGLQQHEFQLPSMNWNS